MFKWAIVKFNLQTPGREPEEFNQEADMPLSVPAGKDEKEQAAPAAEPSCQAQTSSVPAPDDHSRAAEYLRGLGGKDNIKTIDACATRLRLEVADDSVVNAPALKACGARGVIKAGGGAVQVIIGPEADLISDEIKKYLK